jgi:hypothetical protein
MANTSAANGSSGPGVNGLAYPITDHTFDVIVVGAGGSTHCLYFESVSDPLAHRRGARRHLRCIGQYGA